MDSIIFTKEQKEAFYKKAFNELSINVEMLVDLAKEQNLNEAERLDRLIKRNIKTIKMYRNND